MLTDIKNLLIERQEMTLVDLSRHFHVSEAVMESMLEQWHRKGRLIRTEVAGGCMSSCGSCNESSETKIYYQWKQVAQKPIFTQLK